MIRFFAVVNYMVRKFSFLSRKHLPLTQFDQFENSFYFIKHNPEVKIFLFRYLLGTFIFHKKFHTCVAVNFLDETIYSTSISLGTPLWRSNTRKYSLGDSILLAKTKEYTMLYIPDKFQGG